MHNKSDIFFSEIIKSSDTLVQDKFGDILGQERLHVGSERPEGQLPRKVAGERPPG